MEHASSEVIKDGWFRERGKLWPGQAMTLQVDQVLERVTSTFQDILVFKSKTYGTVLVLDGVIQCTERDEFSYQEMMAHLPLFSHPKPENVLIVGGGDGGVVREVLKHTSVRKVVLCEIDEMVIKLAKKYLPSMSSSLDDERVEVQVRDGSKYMQEQKNMFDIIITDSSDPIGPAEALFQVPFYKAMHASLKSDGLLCTQGECMWLHADLIHPLVQSCRKMFPVVKYAYTAIPTYPCGQIGFILCSKNNSTNFCHPMRTPDSQFISSLRYYNSDIHFASFVLPNFARRAILGENLGGVS